jgi:Na+-translocating ferredoxin:NAD+ oxidoreductase subunit E
MIEGGFELGAKKNPALVLVFGLCPVLAVTASLYEALAVGLCVLFMGITLSALVASFDQFLSRQAGPYIWLLVAALLATLCGVVLGALDPYLEKDLGIYVPLLAVNCMIQGQISFSRRSASISGAVSTNLGMAFAFLGVLAAVAVVREALGNGTITLLSAGDRRAILTIPFLEGAPARFFVCSGGAFIILGYVLAASRLAADTRKGKAE